MSRVFISHSSKSNELAAEVLGWLREDGHDVFLDYDRRDGIESGDRWQERLYERLRWTDAVVCIITDDYVTSQWCFGEIVAAKTLGSRILPLTVEEGVRHPLLDDLQHVAYREAQPQAREELRAILREIDAVGGAGWPDDRSPFPGLRAFDVDMRRAFFGRHREVDDLVRLLRSLASRGEGQLVVVVGPSGCGKSSLVRAGLLPAIADEPGWATLTPFMPGRDSVAALAQVLADAMRSTPSQLKQQLHEANGLVPVVEDMLRGNALPPRRRLLAVIDQFEEILTRSSATDRARLAAILRPAISGPLQVVATLRSEFLDALLADPTLAQLPIHSVTLRPLDTATLPRVIEGPARLAGLGVNPELVARMVADTTSGDALPLLAFTLQQLATDLPRGATLSAQRYDQLGGVPGALIRQADVALADALAVNQRTRNGRSRIDILDSLLRLVTVEERGQPTRLEIDYQQLPPPVRAELDSFVAHRLLAIGTRDEMVLIGVAHEAFLSAWPPFAQAISAAGAALRMRRRLEQASMEWENSGRRSSFLWGRDRLAAAVSETGVKLFRTRSLRLGKDTFTSRFHLLRRRREVIVGRIALDPAVRDFLRVGIRHQKRRQRLFFTVVATALVIAFTITTIAVFQRQIAEDQRELATVRGLVAEAEARRGSNPRLALRLGLAAHRIRPTVETGTSLYTTLTSTPLTAILTGHTSSVFGLAYSPNGRGLATASDDGTTALWDLTDQAAPVRMATLTGHTSSVVGVAFSPNGNILVTASADGTAVLWDVADQVRPVRMAVLTGHTSSVNGVAFSPDGRRVATASDDNTAALWDVTDSVHPIRTATLTGHTDAVNGVVFSPDGRSLATASDDNTASLWDVTDSVHPIRTATLTGHTSWVSGVVFSPDGRRVATASDDNTAALWDVTDSVRPVRIATLTGHTNVVFGVAFSPDGRRLATAGHDGTTVLWDLTDSAPPVRNATLTGHTGWLYAVVFSPDGRSLATASTEGSAALWDLTDSAHSVRTATLTGHTSAVFDVAFSPDGHTLATVSDDSTAGVFHINDQTDPVRIATLTGHTSSVVGVAFSSDGRSLATASGDNTAALWDLTDSVHPVRIATLTGHTNGVSSIAFSPQGNILALANEDSTAALWDVNDPARPARTATLTGHTGSVLDVAFSPDGRRLATASGDNTAALWDITDSTQPVRIATLTSHTNWVRGVAFSPDGHMLATAGDDSTVGLWDLTDSVHPTRTATLTGHTGSVRDVAFSPDGRSLATASEDDTAALWDITDSAQPARIATLTGHTGAVFAVAFSRDGRRLATASDDNTTVLWDLRGVLELSGHLISRSCLAAGGGLDSERWDVFAPGIPYQPTC